MSMRTVSVCPPGTRPEVFVGRTPQARIEKAEATRALWRVHGMTAEDALLTLRFSAGATCEPVARAVSEAIAVAERHHRMSATDLVISGGVVSDGEKVTRVRRSAHGKADWITTPTTSISVELTRRLTSVDAQEGVA